MIIKRRIHVQAGEYEKESLIFYRSFIGPKMCRKIRHVSDIFLTCFWQALGHFLFDERESCGHSKMPKPNQRCERRWRKNCDRKKERKMCVIRIGSNRGNPRSKGPEVKSYIFVPALICFLIKDDKKAVVTRTPNRYHKKSCASSDATRIPVCLTCRSKEF